MKTGIAVACMIGALAASVAPVALAATLAVPTIGKIVDALDVALEIAELEEQSDQ